MEFSLIDKVPYSHWKTTTSYHPFAPTGLTAPRILDGPIHAESFRIWVEEFLLSILAPDDGVIMDNPACS